MMQTTKNEKPEQKEKNRGSRLKTYPADCRKIAAVDSHNSIGIERKENIKKN